MLMTNISYGAYAYGRSQETRRQTLGTDSSSTTDTSTSESESTSTSTPPSPTQYPACEYAFLLEGYRELKANGYKIIPPSQTELTDDMRVRAFAKYISDLVEKKRCALVAAYGAGFVPEF